MKSALTALLAICLCLGFGCTKNPKEFEETAAFAERKAKAEAGNATAQNNLGTMYALGDGVPQNFKEALKWFRLAAEQGDEVAQNNLGLSYAQGAGVATDDKEAVKWFRKAAEQGYAEAQFNLGAMYYNGHGVLKNEVTATTWLTIAAVNGHQDAKGNMGAFTKEMTPEQIAEAEELSKEMIEKNPKLLNK